jgi:prolyl oligopeptidase
MSWHVCLRVGGLLRAAVCFGCTAQALVFGASLPDIPTPRQPVTTSYHGMPVVDEYSWLERADAPEVRAWTAQQNARTQSWLARSTLRDELADDLEELYEDAGSSYYQAQVRSNHIFVLRQRPPAPQAALVRLNSVTNLEPHLTVVDASRLDTNGSISIEWYATSLDGKMAAVCLSQLGSESGALHFFDVAGKRKLIDVVPYVQFPTAGGSAVWNTNGTGVFYTRYPHPGEKPVEDLRFYQQVWYHRLGTPGSADTCELGQELPRIAEIELQSSQDGQLILATVAHGDGGEYAHWIRTPSGPWRQLTRFEDGISQVRFGGDGLLYLLSRMGAPRGRIQQLSLEDTRLDQARVFVEQSDRVLVDMVAAHSGLYLREVAGGPSQVRFVEYQTNHTRWLPLKETMSVTEMAVLGADNLLLRTENYTEPFVYRWYDPATNKLSKTALAGSSPVDFSDLEVVRESVVSKDGTQVPLTLLHRKGINLNGNWPTLLYGYGGFGISLAPSFDFTRRLWFDAGGVLAFANLRGGGEFGEEWHQAGRLTRKQNVFDDFVACAEWLIARRYTNPRKLAVEGRSNGGLLAGAVLTQRPDLFRAVAAEVGLYDMLRVELDANGAFNVTEFGSVQDQAQFDALYAYSPYHRIKNGTEYPAVLLTSGEQDGRVNPYHSKKMAARLQAATRSEYPVLLRVSGGAGHGIGSSLNERIAERADVLAFLMNELDMDRSRWVSATPVERGPWSGAITTNSAVIKAKLAKSDPNARLRVSLSVDLSRSRQYKPLALSYAGQRLVTWHLTDLQPNTTYHYAVQSDNKSDLARQGQFRTFPVVTNTFSFAYASCARSGSTNPVFDTIRRLHPSFYMNVGDFHYRDIERNVAKRFARAYDQALFSPVQARLYREVPFIYMWDDHDFGGNRADRKSASRPAARAVYNEYVPHYPMAFRGAQAPICFSFSLACAKFIVTDLRSQRDPVNQVDSPLKSMMGEPQKVWFKRELLEANGRYPLIFWVSTVPWIGQVATNYYPHATNHQGFVTRTNVHQPVEVRKGKYPFNQDDWSAFAYERREIADFISANRIQGLCVLHGDAHMLAADDGSNNTFATDGQGPGFPVLGAAPLDQASSIKGGPYSQGIYRAKSGEGCFGWVTVIDQGQDIEVQFSGRNQLNEEKIALRFKVRR